MLRRGEQVGSYTIHNHLIAGGCSEVYEAGDGGQRFALKILREMKHDEPLLPWRMKNEALVLLRIKHPGVVRLVSHGHHHDGRPYLVLELLDRCLDRHPPVTPQEAVSIAESLARTLASLHAAGIVHRDVKPSNVMLTGDGQPKLVDFGLAKPPVGTSTEEEPLIHLSTDPGAFLGTLAYASPEQIDDAKRVDGKTDVYSLGVTLFQLLTRRLPFVAENKGRLMSMIINDAPPSLLSFNPTLPSELDALVFRFASGICG